MNAQAITSGKKKVDEILQCAACRQRVYPPVRLCQKYHIMCRRCSRRLARCPQCSGPLRKRKNAEVFNLAKRIRLHCIYTDRGCRAEPMEAKERKIHEAFCRHKPLRCAIPSCHWEERPPGANEQHPVPSVRALENHLKKAHSVHLTFCDSPEVTVNVSSKEETKGTMRYVLSHDDELFLAAVETKKLARGTHVRAGISKLDRPREEPTRHVGTIRLTGGECELEHEAHIESFMDTWPGNLNRPTDMAHMYNLTIPDLNKYAADDGRVDLEFSITDRWYDANWMIFE